MSAVGKRILRKQRRRNELHSKIRAGLILTTCIAIGTIPCCVAFAQGNLPTWIQSKEVKEEEKTIEPYYTIYDVIDFSVVDSEMTFIVNISNSFQEYSIDYVTEREVVTTR